MRLFLLFSILSLSFITAADQAKQNEPLLVVLLMVKNEATVMEKTLEPFLQAGVDSYLILDTGSTDDTIAVTQEVFKKYSVKHGYIVEQPFVDFSTSRNYAIQQAEEKFPNAQFFLMIDAEWYMNDVQGLIEFCKSHQNSDIGVFFINLHENCGSKRIFHQNRLLKPRQGIFFEGAVHERLPYSLTKHSYVPEQIYLVYNPADIGQRKTESRLKRDIELLLKEYEKNPQDSHALYYLGQTYECMKDHENAIYWYKKRYDLNDRDERRYIACYHIACIYDELQNSDQAIEYYLKAFNFDQKRAEPLVKLALHYWGLGRYAECYQCIVRSIDIKKPDQAALVEQVVYDYTRYAILSAVALSVSKYEIGKWATLKALETNPNDSALLANLERYQQHLLNKK